MTMKTSRTIFLICFMLSSFVFTAYAQWVQMNGPYGGEITCLEKIGTNIFTGTQNGGVYLSTNNGASWTPVNSGLTTLYIYTLAVSGANLYAGTDGGVFF